MWSHRHLDPARIGAKALILKGSVMRLAGMLALASTVGCVDLGINDDRLTTIWNAQLNPEPAYPGVSGTAAALSEGTGTQASILLQGAEPGASYTWGLWLGTCEGPDQQIGPDTDYPELVAGELGEATQDTRVGPRLSLDQSYHVQVRLNVTDASRVACGDLAGEVAR